MITEKLCYAITSFLNLSLFFGLEFCFSNMVSKAASPTFC